MEVHTMDFAYYNYFTGKAKKDGIEAAADYARALGFTSVEPLGGMDCRYPATVEEAAHMKQVLQSRGMHTACYSVGITVWNNPAAEEALMTHLRVAAAAGSPYFHHTLLLSLAPIPGGPSYEEAMEAVLPVALRVAKRAAELGVMCLYEPQGMYFNGLAGLGTFFTEMKRLTSNVGICADLGNTYFADESVLPILEKFGRDVKHVHVKDYTFPDTPPADGKKCYISKGGKYFRDTLPGTGAVDFAACRRLLDAAGYTGAYAMENSHPEPFEEGVKRAMCALTQGEACIMKGLL
ncbi:MAG: sugar phosphate isomerase/epimerase [Ruminococcaceae bacterium]|nr:sugar phosphate isomerase/epimerase [Oscillospiraceae bacterium]